MYDMETLAEFFRHRINNPEIDCTHIGLTTDKVFKILCEYVLEMEKVLGDMRKKIERQQKEIEENLK